MKSVAKDKTFTALMKENNDLLIEQNLLLTSLNKHLADQESNKGWLERIHGVLECTKKGNNERGSRALVVMAVFSVITLTADYFIQGESSVLFSILKLTKVLT